MTPQSDIQSRYKLLLAREKVLDWQGKREAQAQDLTQLSDLVSNLSDSAKKATVSIRQAYYSRVTSDNAHGARADAILKTAHDLLEERANRILDEESRHKYLTNIPFHRELRAAWEARMMPI